MSISREEFEIAKMDYFNAKDFIDITEKMKEEIGLFHMPAFREIPDVGLYLEQAQKFVSEYFIPLGSVSITSSMISNYVKKGLIKNPVKKQYGREQIAHIFFIAVAKTVISLEEIQLLLDMQKEQSDVERAYVYFCNELESVLQYVFGLSECLPEIRESENQDRQLLRKLIITAAHKIYLDKTFALVTCEKQKKKDEDTKDKK